MTWKYICLLEIWITWFQKELATPQFTIPHMNFKKEILVPFRKLLFLFRVRSHAPSIQSRRGTKVVWPDFQPMRVPEEPVCIDLFRQNPVFTSLHLKSPVHVHRLRTTKDCHSCRSLLLVWQICSLNWDLDIHSSVGSLCISFDGPVAR